MMINETLTTLINKLQRLEDLISISDDTAVIDECDRELRPFIRGVDYYVRYFEQEED